MLSFAHARGMPACGSQWFGGWGATCHQRIVFGPNALVNLQESADICATIPHKAFHMMNTGLEIKTLTVCSPAHTLGTPSRGPSPVKAWASFLLVRQHWSWACWSNGQLRSPKQLRFPAGQGRELRGQGAPRQVLHASGIASVGTVRAWP